MQSTGFPSPLYKGCSVRGLPITAPFRIQYDTEGKGNKIGLFIILPFRLTVPGTPIDDFTLKQNNTPVHSSPTNPEIAQNNCNIENKKSPWTDKKKKSLDHRLSKAVSGSNGAHCSTYLPNRQAVVKKAVRTIRSIGTTVENIQSTDLNERFYVEKHRTKTMTGLQPPVSTKSRIPTKHIQNMSYNDEQIGDNFLPCKIEVNGKNNLSEVQAMTEKEPESEDIDSVIIIKTEVDDSYDVIENSNTKETNSWINDTVDDSVSFKIENEITKQTDASEYGITYTTNGDMKLNFRPLNADLDSAMTDEEGDCVRLMSPFSELINSKKKTSIKQKKSRKKKNSDRNHSKKEENENGSSVKKKKRQVTEENVQLTEMLELKRVKIDEKEDDDESSRRKSSRLRSVGFRPDYQYAENKIDEVLEYLENDNTQMDVAEAEINEDIGEEKKAIEVLGIRSAVKTGNCDLKNTTLDDIEDRGSIDPDYDPEECVIEKQTRNKRNNKIKVKNNDVKERSDTEDGNSDSDTDDFGTKIRKKTSKQKQIKQWIHVKLDEHQDKYKMEKLKSIARKDRGKSETERSVEVFVCNFCNIFKSEVTEAIEGHLEYHLNGKLDCKQCEFSASSVKDLCLHKKDKHRDVNGLMCPRCGIQISAVTLKDHIGTVHKDPQHECIYCLKNNGEIMKFGTRIDLRKHLEKQHRDHGFICQCCEKVFFKKKLFESHKMSCDGKKEKESYCCEKCGANFRTAQYLRVHSNNVHLKIKKYQCTECPYTAVMRSQLVRHMLVHKRVHPYNCSECEFTCVQSYQLKSHMRTHTGEKPYKCTQCKYAAAWNVQLKEHILGHNMETAVMCQNCDILFKNEKTLNIHMKKQQCQM